MQVTVEATYTGRVQQTKYLELVSTGQIYFSDVKIFFTSCHKCQIFERKKKLFPLPLKPISTENPFQQWGLDFIGGIRPPSSSQHKWILIATNYFTKWIESIPTRQATDSIIISFI